MVKDKLEEVSQGLIEREILLSITIDKLKGLPS